MKWVKRAVLLVVAVGLLGLAVWSFIPKPLPVDLGRVRKTTMLVTIDEDGLARVQDRYVVSAPLAGNLARIELHAGDPVEPGTVLARVLPLASPLLDARSRAESDARVSAAEAAKRQADATIERARVALELTRTELARRQLLASRGAASRQEVELAELELRGRTTELESARFGARVAQHQVEMARVVLRRLGDTGDAEQLEITSPVRGRVLRVLAQSEGAIAPGTPLLEIGDPSALEVVVDVLTTDAVRVRAGQRATIVRWGGDRPLAAQVRLVEPSAFTRASALGVEEQRVNVVLDLTDPPSTWARLGDGYRVEAQIVLEEITRVLLVPASALVRRGEAWALFAVEGDRAVERTVHLGARNDLDVEIVRGVREGDSIVLHPPDLLSPGERVTGR